jgi:hypothetical protein
MSGLKRATSKSDRLAVTLVKKLQKKEELELRISKNDTVLVEAEVNGDSQEAAKITKRQTKMKKEVDHLEEQIQEIREKIDHETVAEQEKAEKQPAGVLCLRACECTAPILCQNKLYSLVS